MDPRTEDVLELLAEAMGIDLTDRQRACGRAVIAWHGHDVWRAAFRAGLSAAERYAMTYRLRRTPEESALP